MASSQSHKLPNAANAHVDVNYTSHANAHAHTPRTLTSIRDAGAGVDFGDDSLPLPVRNANASVNSVMPKANNITAYLHYHNYRMGKVIGEGSYSKVKIATRYLQNGTASYRLAVKVISKRRASGDFVTKFLPREIEILSKISHKNIIHVYDLVEFDGNVYIFMDWCDKGDLLEHVKAHGHISENKSRYYFRQLLSAVQYLHGLDFAHRDLKCENILMKALGDQVFISDFGFARYCREKGKRVLSTTYCGSAAYASPEIIQGIPYNPKLYDLWSLGCILFIMMTGHMPYDETNVPKMLEAQQARLLNYPPPSDKRVTDLGKSYIRKMLEPDITRRCNIDQAYAHEWLTTTAPLQWAGDQAAVATPGAGGDGGLEPERNEQLPGLHRAGPSINSSRMPETPRGPRTSLGSYTPQRQTPHAHASMTARASDTAAAAQGRQGNLDDSGYFSPSLSPSPTPLAAAPPMTSRTFYNSNLRYRDHDRKHMHSRHDSVHMQQAEVHGQADPTAPGTPVLSHHHHRRSHAHRHSQSHSHAVQAPLVLEDHEP